MVHAVPSSYLIGVQGHGVTLHFAISNDVPPVTPDGIQWFFEPINGSLMELIPNSDFHYTFSEDKRSLYIYPLQPADEGNYTLVAMNTGGSGSGIIFLDVQGICPSNCCLITLALFCI